MKYLFIIFFASSFVFGQTWQSLTTLSGLSDNQIRCLASDENGTVWIGTRTKGIQGYNGTNFISFPGNSSLPTNSGSFYEITALNVIEDKMYIGVKSSATLGGLWVYNFSTQAINYYGGFEIIGAMDIKVFYKANNGQIYAGSGNGFYKRISDNNWQKIGSGWVQSIAEKSDGTIIYTTFDSLYTFNGVSKKGIKYGLFYSVVFDNNDIGYVSDGNDVYKFADNNNFNAMGFSGFSKAMVKDKNGIIWITSAGTSFGIKKIDGNIISTFNTGNSPLLSTDMTCACVTNDNRKFFGHYNAGLNSILDVAVILPISVVPENVQMYVNDNVNISISNGIAPYSAWVNPINLGNINLNNSTLNFTALNVGLGKIYVTGGSGSDTAEVYITVLSNSNIPKLKPTGFDVSKGTYNDKITIKWVIPGEFEQGFEDGIPAEWKTNPDVNNQTSWSISGFQPHSGSKAIKFDVYSPGLPLTDWLITEKIHVSPEKPRFKMFLKTAFALGNSYSSYIRLSTVNQEPSSFSTILKELSPVYLADSNLIWRPIEINLTNYINQDVFIAFECKAEDIIIYLDDMQMFGQSGLTSIGQSVQKYNLYKSTDSTNLQNSSNVIYSGLETNFADNNIIPLSNYYYGVSAVYNDNFETEIAGPTYGIAYSQNDSLIIENASTVIPNVDGQIKENEYSDAIKVILTKRGYFADSYLKVANNKLFIAIDAFADTSLDEDDYLLFAFDKNRSFSYEEGTEGYYRLRKTSDGIEKAFFPFTVLGFNQGILNPDGFEGIIGNINGHNQYEISIDLSTSVLNLNSTSKIGAYIGSYNSNLNLESSWLERLLSAEYSVMGFGSITFNSLVNITETVINKPYTFELFNNYPNPFNPSTTIKFAIPAESFVNLEIFNTLGERIEVITNELLKAGYYTYNFNASNLSSGVYFYKISAKSNDFEFNKTNKMLLIK